MSAKKMPKSGTINAQLLLDRGRRQPDLATNNASSDRLAQ